MGERVNSAGVVRKDGTGANRMTGLVTAIPLSVDRLQASVECEVFLTATSSTLANYDAEKHCLVAFVPRLARQAGTSPRTTGRPSQTQSSVHSPFPQSASTLACRYYC